jgi:hypothetical protein
VVLPIVALLAVAIVVVALVWKRQQIFVVAYHTWQRSIVVERLGPARETVWCSELPASASDVSRHRERHGSKKVPDGETCHAQKKDRGDGTFKEEQVCAPQFKDEPVYEEKCDYVVVKWSQVREEVVKGAALADEPRWPAVTLSHAGCSTPGCEREGTRSQSYAVFFKDQAGETYRCELVENAWASFSQGKRYSGKLRALVGSLDCDSLVAAR